jgi:predicted phosphodiesterase
MPSDKTLFQRWQDQYQQMNSRQAANALAMEFGLDPDSVAGRLSRYGASTEPKYVNKLKALANEVHEVDPSISAQDEILERDAKIWAKLRLYCKTAVFASDLHFPYARWDAIELMFRVLEDVKVDIFTTGNDTNDNSAYGRWEDKRPLSGRKWSNDTAYGRSLEGQYYLLIDEVTKAQKVQVQGNHDNWWYIKLREAVPTDAEGIIADYMKWLSNRDVLQFSKGYTENALHLNDALTFWHGQFASSKTESNAKSTLQQFAQNGMVRSVVVGHTHRPATIEGYRAGYPDRFFINSPCLSRIENVPYMKRNPHGWGLGFVIAEYEEGTRHKATRIDFTEHGGYLHAEYKGKSYAIKVDKSTPKEF